MWDSLADLISSLVSVLVVVIPFYLYVLITKRRIQSNKVLKETQESSDISDIEIVEISEAPETPDYYQPQPQQKKQSAGWNNVSTSDQETDEVEEKGVFSRLEAFPLNKRAIVISEILGSPKAFRD
jgi:hypothetical protein